MQTRTVVSPVRNLLKGLENNGTILEHMQGPGFFDTALQLDTSQTTYLLEMISVRQIAVLVSQILGHSNTYHHQLCIDAQRAH